MKTIQYSEDQIIAMLRQAEAGAKVGDLCRKYGMSHFCPRQQSQPCVNPTLAVLH